MDKTYVNEIQYEILMLLKERMSLAVSDIAKRINREPQALMREIAELERKGLVSKNERKILEARLTDEARSYVKKGLPEVRLVKALLDLKREGKLPAELSSLRKVILNNYGLSENEYQIALRHLISEGFCSVKEGRLYFERCGIPETFVKLEGTLRRLSTHPIVTDLSMDLVKVLKRRKLVKLKERKEVILSLTDRGRKLLLSNLIEPKKVITRLTPEIIMSRQWDKAIFKEYDLGIEVPDLYPARKHPYMEILDMMKDVLTSMGFEEVKGPYVELEFWNFDALFQAQDHPVRDMHDSYYVKGLGNGSLTDMELIERVKAVHENGWITGSRGWGYKWDLKLALRLILRTHTTAVSARELYKRGEGEYRLFSLDRVFRRESLDPTHSMEFYQLEGIIVSKRLSFKHLLGFFVEFSKLMGLGEPKFKPAYFPYTEPSVEGYIRHPKLGWIEVFPGGLFRPEVLLPLGIKRCRVAAWGIGVDRLAMAILGIDDIRLLFSKDIGFLRSLPLPLRGGIISASSRSE